MTKTGNNRHKPTCHRTQLHYWKASLSKQKQSTLRVVGHGYCAALKECADLGFVVN